MGQKIELVIVGHRREGESVSKSEGPSGEQPTSRARYMYTRCFEGYRSKNGRIRKNVRKCIKLATTKHPLLARLSLAAHQHQHANASHTWSSSFCSIPPPILLHRFCLLGGLSIAAWRLALRRHRLRRRSCDALTLATLSAGRLRRFAYPPRRTLSRRRVATATSPLQSPLLRCFYCTRSLAFTVGSFSPSPSSSPSPSVAPYVEAVVDVQS